MRSHILHTDLISASIIELTPPPLSPSLHLHISSVSWNIARRTHGSNGRTKPPNRKHNENATNGAWPSNEGQRRGGRNDKKRQEKVGWLVAEQSAGRQTIAPLSTEATAQASCFQRRWGSLSLSVRNRHCFFNEEDVF